MACKAITLLTLNTGSWNSDTDSTTSTLQSHQRSLEPLAMTSPSAWLMVGGCIKCQSGAHALGTPRREMNGSLVLNMLTQSQRNIRRTPRFFWQPRSILSKPSAEQACGSKRVSFLEASQSCSSVWFLLNFAKMGTQGETPKGNGSRSSRNCCQLRSKVSATMA